jgi:hypothetical protein
LFDTAGDKVGFFQAIWIIVVFVVCGLFWNYSNQRWNTHIITSHIRDDKQEDGIELKDKPAHHQMTEDQFTSMDNPLHQGSIFLN